MYVKHHFGDIYTALQFLTPQSLIIIPICHGFIWDGVNFLLSGTYLPVGVKPQHHFFLQHFSKNDLFRSINIITLNTQTFWWFDSNQLDHSNQSNLMCSHTGSFALRVNMIYLMVWSSDIHLITYSYRLSLFKCFHLLPVHDCSSVQFCYWWLWMLLALLYPEKNNHSIAQPRLFCLPMFFLPLWLCFCFSKAQGSADN